MNRKKNRATEDKCCHEGCYTVSDAVCRHCGQEFCRVHIVEHLKKNHKRLTIDTERDSC